MLSGSEKDFGATTLFFDCRAMSLRAIVAGMERLDAPLTDNFTLPQSFYPKGHHGPQGREEV